jgi:hypothetical protein
VVTVVRPLGTVEQVCDTEGGPFDLPGNVSALSYSTYEGEAPVLGYEDVNSSWHRG